MRAHGVSKSLTHSADAATAPSTPGSSTLATPTVLVVDDEPSVRALLTDALQIEGFKVVTAASGLTALDHVASRTFSSAILDIRMPELDGMETLRRLRELAPRLPVIVLTGYGDIPSAVETMRLGASDYLTKPVRPEAIGLAGRRALERQQLDADVEGLRRQLRHRGAAGGLIRLGPESQ